MAGAALMVLGIGLVAVLTAPFAAHFVGEDEASLKAEIGRLHSRLDDLERLLAARPQVDPYDVGADPASHTLGVAPGDRTR